MSGDVVGGRALGGQYKCEEMAFALKQINEKEYYAQYLHTNVPIALLDINLSKRKESNNSYIDIACDIKNDDHFF